MMNISEDFIPYVLNCRHGMEANRSVTAADKSAHFICVCVKIESIVITDT